MVCYRSTTLSAQLKLVCREGLYLTFSLDSCIIMDGRTARIRTLSGILEEFCAFHYTTVRRNTIKYCKTCDSTLPLDRFAKKGKGYQSYCKDCRKVWFKAHYQENKTYYKERNKENKNNLRDWLNNYKHGLSCAICNETESCTFDFHHLDPTEKEYNISQLVGCNSRALLEKELSKCVLLCANCHRKVHAGVLSLAP